MMSFVGSMDALSGQIGTDSNDQHSVIGSAGTGVPVSDAPLCDISPTVRSHERDHALCITNVPLYRDFQTAEKSSLYLETVPGYSLCERRHGRKKQQADVSPEIMHQFPELLKNRNGQTPLNVCRGCAYLAGTSNTGVFPERRSGKHRSAETGPW
jgi:hypothetical protein